VTSETLTIGQLQSFMVVITIIIIAVSLMGYYAFRWFIEKETRKNRGGR